jgi:hypothetical protein
VAFRSQVPAQPHAGGHGRIRTLDEGDVLGGRASAPCFAARSAADDGSPRAGYPKETTSTGWFNAFVSWLTMHGMVKPKA